MKKRIGICFFIGTLCAVVVAQGALLFAHEYNKKVYVPKFYGEHLAMVVIP